MATYLRRLCAGGSQKEAGDHIRRDVLAEIEALPEAPSTHNLAAIGPAMTRANKMGILGWTDRVKRSERPDKHGNRQNVWISNYYQRS